MPEGTPDIVGIVAELVKHREESHTQVEQANRHKIYDADGDLVTQGAFNALIGKCDEAIKRCNVAEAALEIEKTHVAKRDEMIAELQTLARNTQTDSARIAKEREEARGAQQREFELVKEKHEQWDRACAERDEALREVETITKDRDGTCDMLSKSEAKVEELLAKLAEKEAEIVLRIEGLNEQYVKVVAERDKAIDERDAADEKGNQTWTDLNNAKAELDALKSQIDQATDGDPSSSDALAQMTKGRDHYHDECADLRIEIASLKDEIAVLQKRAAAVPTKITTFEERCGNLSKKTRTEETPPPSVPLAKLTAKLTKYRNLVEAVGRKLTECPPSIKAAYGAAIAR